MWMIVDVIYNEDCLEGMKKIPNGSIDMILCDLPYGTTACKWDNIIPFEPLWEQYNRIIKDNGAIVLFGSEPFSSKLRLSNLKNYKYDWIWDKVKPSGHLNAKYMPLKQHEIISVFCKGKCNYYPIMITQEPRISKNYIANKSDLFGKEKQVKKIVDKKYPKTILTVSNAIQKNKLHPTEKSIKLLEYLIKTYTNENELVLDNCMGSGSTGVACVNTNRNFIGIELDEKYFNIAKERIEKVGGESER
jgi:site-specific DNA-methyltransferase (adenine-specific)